MCHTKNRKHSYFRVWWRNTSTFSIIKIIFFSFIPLKCSFNDWQKFYDNTATSFNNPNTKIITEKPFFSLHPKLFVFAFSVLQKNKWFIERCTACSYGIEKYTRKNAYKKFNYFFSRYPVRLILFLFDYIVSASRLSFGSHIFLLLHF